MSLFGDLVKVAESPDPAVVRALIQELLGSGEHSKLPVLERSVGGAGGTFIALPNSASRADVIQAIGQRNSKDLATGRSIHPIEVADRVRAMPNSGHAKGVVSIDPTLPNRLKIPVLAHELGHSSAMKKGLMNALRLYAYPLSSSLGRIPALGVLPALGTAMMDTESSAVMAAPLAAVVASQVPVLAEEGIASVKALRALKKLKQATMWGDLLKSWGSYARNSAMLAAPTAGILAYKKIYDK
jgi:hypothetical protein